MLSRCVQRHTCGEKNSHKLKEVWTFCLSPFALLYKSGKKESFVSIEWHQILVNSRVPRSPLFWLSGGVISLLVLRICWPELIVYFPKCYPKYESLCFPCLLIWITIFPFHKGYLKSVLECNFCNISPKFQFSEWRAVSWSQWWYTMDMCQRNMSWMLFLVNWVSLRFIA